MTPEERIAALEDELKWKVECAAADALQLRELRAQGSAAILVERQRCAAVAKQEARRHFLEDPYIYPFNNGEVVLQAIADAILEEPR